MANITHGMNVEAVQGISTKLTNEANAIQTVIKHVDSLLAQSAGVWVGPDQKLFDGLWHQHRPSLVTLEGSLRDLAVKAKSNADKQAQESSHL